MVRWYWIQLRKRVLWLLLLFLSAQTNYPTCLCVLAPPEAGHQRGCGVNHDIWRSFVHPIPHEALIWSLVSIGLRCALRRLLPFEVGFRFWAPTLLSWSFDQYRFSLGSVMHIAFLLHCLVQHQLIVIRSKLFICSGLPRRKSLVMVVLLANLSALSFPLTSE